MKLCSRFLMGVVFAGIASAQTPTITSGGVTNARKLCVARFAERRARPAAG